MKIELPEPLAKAWAGSEEIPLYSDMQVMKLIRAERNRWQPIETAPEDEWVLIALSTGEVYRAVLTLDDGEYSPAWYLTAFVPLHPKLTPTHWQPLPEPPSERT